MLAYFTLGAVFPTLLLLSYNQLAFGSPLDMGYFHEVIRDFAEVHSPDNPLGMRAPDWGRLAPLLWGRYRGLLFYAPILLLTLPGWVALWARRQWEPAVLSVLVVASVILVNLGYPEWTGGWSTGPRLLLPMIPFAMIAVAALLAGSGAWTRVATLLGIGLAIVGGAEMLLFQGVDARIPHEELDLFGHVRPLSDPLPREVWPLWLGQEELPTWRFGARFCRNLVSETAPRWIARLKPRWQWIQFLPLILLQGAAILACWKYGSDWSYDSATPQRTTGNRFPS
jgi:hypothetical protein